jgi:hypothetical protein
MKNFPVTLLINFSVILIKNPVINGGGIEDFSLKYLRIRGNKSPHPQYYALNGGELTLK